MHRAAAHRSLLEVIDHAYAGVLGPARFRDAPQSIAVLFDVRAAGLKVETYGQGVSQDWVGLKPDFDRAYVAHYWQDDPWATQIWNAEVGVFAHGDAVCARAVVEASNYHNELALRHRFDVLGGALLERTPERVALFGMLKGKGAANFNVQNHYYAKALTPHWVRSLALRDHVQTLLNSANKYVRHAHINMPAIAMCGSQVTVNIETALRPRYGLTVAEARVALRARQVA